MKYGKIIDNEIKYVFRTDDNDEWAGGLIEYKIVNGEQVKKTASEMISDNGLKPIITPYEFSGSLSDYNFVETDTEITVADKKAEVTNAETVAALKAELKTLETQLNVSQAHLANYKRHLEQGKPNRLTESEYLVMCDLHDLRCNRCAEIQEQLTTLGVEPNE